jgi:hypothetical protein
MVRDQARNNGFASVLDDLSTRGNWRFGRWTDGDNAPVADDDCGIVKRSAAASINEASTPKGSGLRMRCRGRPDDKR